MLAKKTTVKSTKEVEIPDEIAKILFDSFWEEAKKNFILVPVKAQNRYRVEVVGEMAEAFKDSGLTFATVENAEIWCRENVPKNISWRILYETMNVVKFYEYKASYIA